MTTADLLGVGYLLATVVGFGSSTVFLRMAIVAGTTDTARLLRVGIQTLVVLAGVLFVGAVSFRGLSLHHGAMYPALNGLLSGAAFIGFSKGLESEEASTAKPMLAIATLVSVMLGVVFLGEYLTLRKLAGIAFGIGALYLLTTE